MGTTKFGQLLRRLRMSAGENGGELSYRELAARSGHRLSHQTIWAIENGTRQPPRDVEKIRALAQGLGNTTYEALLEAAGYLRRAGASGDAEVAAVLSRSGLSEAGIAEVEAFVAFVREREAARPKRRRSAAR